MINIFKKKSIFELAKETNKKLVFIFFENKVYLTLAEKKLDGTVSFEIYKDGKFHKYRLRIQPSQEFLLHTPKIEIVEKQTIYDYLLNRDIKLNLQNPKDVIFELQPYDLEAIFLIYPHEILSTDELKNFGLIKIGEKEARYNDKKIIIDVYSPTTFAIDKQTIKFLSAKSRISQIDTILEMTKNLLERTEELYHSSIFSKSIFSILSDKRIIFIILLAGILVLSILFFTNFITPFTKTLTTTLPKPTFP